MSKRVSSRLAKKKKKKLAKQSVVLLLLSILIGSIFVFLILPTAVRFFFDFLDKETNLSEVDTIPPQPPVAVPPPNYTQESKITLEGYGEAEAQVHLVVNNQKQDKVEIDDQGQFSVTANLSEGENQLKIYSTDEAGNESVSKIYQVVKDTQPPEIKIGFPEDGASFELQEDQVITVRGETEPLSKVSINETVIYADSQGLFSGRLRLMRGENAVKIQIEDQAGNKSEHELTVYYRR